MSAAKAAEVIVPYDVANVRIARRQAVVSVQTALGIIRKEGSAVIASKVIHFWDPDLAPMIDKNVAKAWKRLAGRGSCDWKVNLAAAGNPRLRTISESPRVEQYLSYWELAYRMRMCDPAVSYRDIDELMFCHGR